MKTSIVLLSAAIGLAAAVPRHNHHMHQHHHEMKRDSTVTTDIDTVAGPTIVMYSLNGNIISEDEVREGIQNGTLIWAHGAPEIASSSSVAPSTSSPAPSSTTFSTSSTSSISSSSTTSSVVSSWSTSWSSSSSSSSSSSTSSQDLWDVATSLVGNLIPSATSSSSSSASSSSSSSSSSGVDQTFPDGEISCSDFPSNYGAVSLEYLGLGGWTGVQSPGSDSGSGFSNIETITSSTCSGSGCCSEGMYCSYACPAGYQKAHWPSTQGSSGQSVGGIQCKNGKLYKTNSDYDTLCITGTDIVTVLVKNDMSTNAAVCRTDYPGTESETVPLSVEAGSTNNLTCPDSTYYQWTGQTTSAQYYVNPAGVSPEDGCQWGHSGNPWGNFAPLNLGVGYSSGAAWLAIFQNSPTTEETLDFTVEIQGDNMSGYCRYKDGQYCSGENYDDCGSSGCTVSVTSGTAYFVFSN